MKKVFLIGIGGSGLSAIARLLVERGYQVMGSDQNPSALTDSLAKLGIEVFIGHQAEQVLGADFIIRSSAIPEDNPEVLMARRLGIPVFKRAEFLASFLADKKVIAVAGTHGKTTTTAMISWLLTASDQDPGYLIGGVSKNLGANAHAGTNDLFVIEADEYDYMFLGLQPQIAVVTNIEHDHPDLFTDPETYFDAFSQFLAKVKPDGLLLVSHEIPEQFPVLKNIQDRVFTYGVSDQAIYQAANLSLQKNGCFQFDVIKNKSRLVSIKLNIPGEHNVKNALAAIGVLDLLRQPLKRAARDLELFEGTGRRFEIVGEYGGITLIDDYAHHPTEIRTVLQTAKHKFPEKRIIAVWQPHTFTRSRQFFKDYLAAFENADEVIVTEIYAAREKENVFSASELVEQIQHDQCIFVPDLNKVYQYLQNTLSEGDVLLVLSAGDAIMINQKLKKGFETLNAQAESISSRPNGPDGQKK